MLEILLDAIRSAVLVSGLVVVMMMIIESLNIDSHGRLLGKLKNNRPAQIVVSGLLGLVPGCVGGFASVSLYTHGIIGFGALVAMMIASSGDEAFVMIATMPDKAWWIFLILFCIAVCCGFIVDKLYRKSAPRAVCERSFEVHDEDGEKKHKHANARHFGWKRIVMFLGVAAFITALLAGWLECGCHEHAAEHGESTAVCAGCSTECEGHELVRSAECAREYGLAGERERHSAASVSSDRESFKLNLLSEEWMYWLFGALSLIVLIVLITGSDHFVEEHLWQHIIKEHLASIFLWTFGVLVIVGAGLHYLDIGSWISSNTALMILLATLVGIIPESGPHMVFVTLYASGIIPLPVLLASCISQDGHSSLPLLAESKKDFLIAKGINCLIALAAGFAAMLIV